MGRAESSTKTIYLLRHAKSSWKDHSLDDFDRPLNKRGKAAREVMARYFDAKQIRPDLVLCSTARRARATVKPILPVIGAAAVVRYEDSIYHASPASILGLLNGIEDTAASILVVGHSPGVDELALCLTDDDESELRSRMVAKFPTCALAVLTASVDHWKDLNLGLAHLESFVRPRDLENQ